MKIGTVRGRALQYMCVGPLCFHGFTYAEKAIIKLGDGGLTRLLCLQWGEMIPN